jgi:hypothetical protein
MLARLCATVLGVSWLALAAVGCSSSGSESSATGGGGTAGSGGGASGGVGGSSGSSTGGTTGTGATGGIGGTSASGGSSGGGPGPNAKILFLHHSTGGVIWGGGVADWIDTYNSTNGTSYAISEQAFPDAPYPWANYPYDYWNIWISHAGNASYEGNPTLEMLTPDYQVIVWKHCFPVSGVGPDTGSPSVSSESKTLENYKLQYAALKDKMHAFPSTTFIVWTGAALKQSETNAEDAQRAKDFFDWVKGSWDEKGDNIFVWDFWQLETGGGLYLLDANASGDSHPNDDFAKSTAPLFGQRVVDVIEGRGDTGSLTGE